MKKNKITVFNGCVDTHLEELDYFENLIQKHYQKFTYGYNILSAVNLFDKINKVDCIFMDKDIKFIANFKRKITKKDTDLINDGIAVAYNNKKFIAIPTIDNMILVIHIMKNSNYIDTFE